MGEAKRRCEGARERAELQAGLDTVHAEGGGVYELTAYDQYDVVRLVGMARAGNAKARSTLKTLDHFVEVIATRPAGETVLCLTCSNDFTRVAPACPHCSR